MDAREGLEASQYAAGGNNQKRPREMRTNEEDRQTDLKAIEQDIQIAIKGLKDEGIESTWLITLGELATRVKHASNTRQTSRGVEVRLKAIEDTLKALKRPDEGKRPSWAEIAAESVRPAGIPTAPPQERNRIRATMPQAKGMGNQEILKEIKKTIPGAAAIRVLYSGDINIIVPDEATRDRAQGLPPTQDLKIHKKDYLVEVLGVPLNTRVAGGKQANNETLASTITEASKSLTPGIRITRVT
jgi:hypothetical protein